MSFGGTIKLTGEDAYDKALKDITGGLKVLSSEMQKVTAEYGKNDTSVEGLNSKNKVLNEQIDLQKEKVSELQKVLSKAKTATGDNSATTQKWQIELNKAETELNKMNKSISDNENTMEKTTEATKRGYSSIEEYSKATARAERQSDIFWGNLKSRLLEDVFKGGLKALADGISNVASAFNDTLKAGAGYSDNILTLSTQTGLSTETLQKYNAVAELVDVSTETLTGSMAKNIKSMSSNNDAYTKLGITVKDTNGKLRDSETVYWETIDALGKVNNETERNSLSMTIFGKSAQDLNPLIAQGSAGIKTLGDEAVRMGAVVSDKGLKALGDLDDEMQKSATISKSAGNILASAFAPAVSSMMGGLNDIGSAFTGLIANILGGDDTSVEEAMTYFSDTIGTFIDNISEQLPRMLEVGTQLVEQLVIAITDNLPMILEAGINALNTLLGGISSNLDKILPIVIDTLMTLVDAVIENLPTIINAGIQILLALVKGIGDSLPKLIPTFVQAIMTILDTIVDNIDLIIDAGISIILGLIDGIIEAIPKLIDKIPVIIEKLIVGITNNLDKIIVAGVQLTISLAGGLIKGIPQLVSKIPQIIGAIVSGLLEGMSQIAEVGKNLIVGLWNGINNTLGWIKDKIAGFGKAILGGIKSFFGIHSPSTVFRDEIGKNLALGVGEGFSSNMNKIADDMQNSIPTEFDLGVNIHKNTISNLSNDVSKGQLNQSTSNFNGTNGGLLTDILTELREIKTQQLQMQIILDSGELVGGLKNKIDQALDDNDNLGDRGVAY